MPDAMVDIKEFSVTILNGAQDSDAIKIVPHLPVALVMPAAFTGTAITFWVSDSLAGTYVQVYNAGTAVSATVAASRHVILDPTQFYGARYLKIRSGSAEGADRIVKILARRLLVR